MLRYYIKQYISYLEKLFFFNYIMSVYTFINNNKEFKISLTRRKLYLIPEEKNTPFDELDKYRRYEVQSHVSNDTFESFLNSWKNDEPPHITDDNFYEYYQLDNEFGIFTDFINQPQFKQFTDLSMLIKSKNYKNFDRSFIEKKVTSDLNNYLTNSANCLKQVPINSLYNIFNHPDRSSIDHDLAYHFIVDAASDGKECFYVLLESLDSDKMKSIENQRDSIVNFRKHHNFAPQNSESFILGLEKRLENVEKVQLVMADQNN